MNQKHPIFIGTKLMLFVTLLLDLANTAKTHNSSSPLGSDANSIAKSGMFSRWRRRIDNGRAVFPRQPFDSMRLDGRYACNSPSLSENQESMERLGEIYF